MKHTSLLCLCISLSLSYTLAAEFRVNTYKTLDQKDPDIALLPSGGFVVVWSSYGQDGNSNGIYGRVFDPNGIALTNEFLVNQTTAGNQKSPDVAADNQGNFIVVWQGPGPSEHNGDDIFAQMFDPNGVSLANEFRVNSYTDNEQLDPAVAINNSGNFIVVWESINIPGDQKKKRSICAQLFDSSGSAVGSEFVVNDELSKHRHPDVTIDNEGKFIVVWVRESTQKSVWIRHFEANGSAPYPSSKVNDDFDFTSLTYPSVAIDDLGNYVIAWDGHKDTSEEDDIYLKIYDPNHTPLNEKQLLVNSYQVGAQTEPDVAVNNQGQFVIVWQSKDVNEEIATDIYAQRFNESGSPIGNEFRLNTCLTDRQEDPAVVLSDAGYFVTVWESYGQDDSRYGIFGQMVPKAPAADFNNDGFINFRDFCILADEWRKSGDILRTDLINDNRIDEKDLAALCKQWLKP